MKHISTTMILLLTMAWAVLPVLSAPAPAGLGTWWRDSEVVRELQLRDSQIQQIEQAVLKHRTTLTDLAAELERHETLLQSLVAAARLDEKEAAAQVDEVVSARGKLEKERTTMMLEIRRAVSIGQWNKLQEMQQAEANRAAGPAATVSNAPQKTQGSPAKAEEPIYAVGGPVKSPIPLRSPLPPSTSRPGEGVLVLQAIVGKDGLAKNVKVLHGINSALTEWAIKTVPKEWIFKPGTLENQSMTVSVSVLTTIGLSFHAGKVDIWWSQ